MDPGHTLLEVLPAFDCATYEVVRQQRRRIKPIYFPAIILVFQPHLPNLPHHAPYPTSVPHRIVPKASTHKAQIGEVRMGEGAGSAYIELAKSRAVQPLFRYRSLVDSLLF